MTTPNPGSALAVDAGCRCPVLDNAHGKGCYWGEGKFFINGDCPLHSPQKFYVTDEPKVNQR